MGRIQQIEQDLPLYLSQVVVTSDPATKFFYSCRVQTVLQFVRTLIARQALIDEAEASTASSKLETSFATSEACRLSVDTVKTYSRLRHLGLLQFCGFHAISHVTAAAHTLIACMLRSFDLAFEHRPDLLTAIDILLVFSTTFPNVETVAQLLFQMSRTLDHNHGSDNKSELVAIRVLASKMTRPHSRVEQPLLKPGFSKKLWKGDSTQRIDPELMFKHTLGPDPYDSSSNYNQPSISNTDFSAIPRGNISSFITNDTSSWPSLLPIGPVDSDWTYDASEHAVWGDSFSFLNDGLISKL